MLDFIFNELISIKRRASNPARDSFNNPIYGTPTTTWTSVYTNMPCRFAFNSKDIEFNAVGERITPNGVMYFSSQYTLQPEDRVLTADGIEYTVSSISKGYLGSSFLHHYEARVILS